MELPVPEEVQSLIKDYASDRIGIHPVAQIVKKLKFIPTDHLSIVKIILAAYTENEYRARMEPWWTPPSSRRRIPLRPTMSESQNSVWINCRVYRHDHNGTFTSATGCSRRPWWALKVSGSTFDSVYWWGLSDENIIKLMSLETDENIIKLMSSLPNA